MKVISPYSVSTVQYLDDVDEVEATDFSNSPTI